MALSNVFPLKRGIVNWIKRCYFNVRNGRPFSDTSYLDLDLVSDQRNATKTVRPSETGVPVPPGIVATATALV